MYRKTIFAVAAIAASVGMLVGMATVPYSQTAVADKDCSVGKALQERETETGREWSQLVSEYARNNQGAGEVFTDFNQFCHAD